MARVILNWAEQTTTLRDSLASQSEDKGKLAAQKKNNNNKFVDFKAASLVCCSEGVRSG